MPNSHTNLLIIAASAVSSFTLLPRSPRVKIYSLPNLTQPHEQYILDHFKEHVHTYLKKSMVQSADSANDLIRKYMPMENPTTGATIGVRSPIAGNKFKAWLVAAGAESPSSCVSKVT